MKFIPDIFLFLSGLKDTHQQLFRSAAAVGFMTSRSIMLINGTRDQRLGTTEQAQTQALAT